MLHETSGSGYGSSKAVAEQVLRRASTETALKTIVVRIGQLSGSSVNGAWNRSDWVPIMLASAPFVHCLPCLPQVCLTLFCPLRNPRTQARQYGFRSLRGSPSTRPPRSSSTSGRRQRPSLATPSSTSSTLTPSHGTRLFKSSQTPTRSPSFPTRRGWSEWRHLLRRTPCTSSRASSNRAR